MHRASNSTNLSPGSSEPQHPSVSVIIAYYKQEHFLAETVRVSDDRPTQISKSLSLTTVLLYLPVPFFQRVVTSWFYARRIVAARQPETLALRRVLETSWSFSIRMTV